MRKHVGGRSWFLVVTLLACGSPQQFGIDKSDVSDGGKSSRRGGSSDTDAASGSAGIGGISGTAGNFGGASGSTADTGGRAGSPHYDVTSGFAGMPPIHAGSGGAAGPRQGGFAGGSLGTMIGGECMDTRPGVRLDPTCPPTYCELRAQIAALCGARSVQERRPPQIDAAYEDECSNMKSILIIVSMPSAYGCRYQNNVLVGTFSTSDTGEFCGGATPFMGVGVRPEACTRRNPTLCYATRSVIDEMSRGGAAGAPGIIPGAAGSAQTGNGACYDAATDSCVSCP